MAKNPKADYRKTMTLMAKAYRGESHLIRLGVQLEKLRVKLGSAKALIEFLHANDLPSGLACDVYGLKETGDIDEHIN